MKKNKNVLISVYDKINLEDIAKFLIKKKYTIYSTGGSSDYLKKIGINVNTIPGLDVLRSNTNKIIGNRSFSKRKEIFCCILWNTNS